MAFIFESFVISQHCCLRPRPKDLGNIEPKRKLEASVLFAVSHVVHFC